jgi:hypothetical protein
MAYVKWSRGILLYRLRNDAKKLGFPTQKECVCLVKLQIVTATSHFLYNG